MINLRDKLKRWPLRTLAALFFSFVVAGVFRSGPLFALVLLAWSSFGLMKLAFAVKARVEEKQQP